MILSEIGRLNEWMKAFQSIQTLEELNDITIRHMIDSYAKEKNNELGRVAQIVSEKFKELLNKKVKSTSYKKEQ